jgi:hypothetical protein
LWSVPRTFACMDWWTRQRALVWSSQFVDHDLNLGHLKYDAMLLHLKVILKQFPTIQHQSMQLHKLSRVYAQICSIYLLPN